MLPKILLGIFCGIIALFIWLLRSRMTKRLGLLMGAAVGAIIVALIISPCAVDVNSRACMEGVMGLNFMTLLIPALIFNHAIAIIIGGFIMFALLGSMIGYFIATLMTEQSLDTIA